MEESRAASLQRIFRDGKVSDAFLKAMNLQADGASIDYIGRLCALVPDSLEDWLQGSGGHDAPLSMQVKLLLIFSLATQLEEGSGLSEAACLTKISWIAELWFVLDLPELSEQASTADTCRRLSDVLERIGTAGLCEAGADQLRSVKKAVQQAA